MCRRSARAAHVAASPDALRLRVACRPRPLRAQVEILEIQERKNGHINELMRRHEKAFGEIKNYYNDITHNNLDLIRSLKEEVADMNKKARRRRPACARPALDARTRTDTRTGTRLFVYVTRTDTRTDARRAAPRRASARSSRQTRSSCSRSRRRTRSSPSR